MASLGIDISTPVQGSGEVGLDPYFSLASEGTAYVQAIARRWVTPRGSLYRHPEYGHDVRQYLNDDLDAGDLPGIESALAEEARADERTDDASVSVAFADGTLTVTGLLATITGQTFRLVLAVGEVSTTVLYAEAL